MGRGRSRGMTKKQKKAAKAAKNNNKGKNKMFQNIKKAAGFGVNATLPDSTIREYTTLNVALFSQATLNVIRDIGLPAAGGSEYQVHYRGVQVIVESHSIEEDPRRIVFTIPTVFFNFPQKVTSVAVDFNLTEVAAISEQCIPISDALSAKYMEAFPIKDFEEKGWKVSVREMEVGSIHRHPSAFGFSGTDLDNRADNPGVIFRNLEVKDKIQTDSVMYLPSATQDTQLVTTETRIVDVAPVKDGIEGTYARASTLTYILKNAAPAVTSFSDFFAASTTPEVEAEVEFKVHKDIITDEYEEIEALLKDFVISAEYAPQVVMDPKFIESTTYYYQGGGRGTYNSRYGYHGNTSKPVTHHSGRDSRHWDDDDYYDAAVPQGKTHGSTGGSVSETETPLTVRPTWRKDQTINALRTKGIKVDTIKEITGDASDEDIIAIATEMKNENFSDIMIRDLFAQMGYPRTALHTYYTKIAADAEADDVPVTQTNVAEGDETLNADVIVAAIESEKK